MPKVSVIVPVYNTEVYLKKCLTRLINQTYSDIEFILIDDGSTDSSSELLEEFAAKDSRIRLVHKKNGGQASARNLGIQMAQGDYISFADSDDYVDFTLFEKMVKKAEQTKADMVECKFFFFEEKGTETRQLKARGRIREYKNRKDMFIDPQVSPWNKLYKREIIQNTVTFPEGLIYEDTSFYIKTIPYLKKTACVEEELVNYLLHPSSTINSNKNKKVGDMFSVLTDAIQFYQENGFYTTYEKELEYFCTKIVLCSSLGRIGRIQDRNLRKKLLSRSFSFLSEYFPNYKKNPYLQGKIGLYMKLVNRQNCELFARIIGKVLKG